MSLRMSWTIRYGPWQTVPPDGARRGIGAPLPTKRVFPRSFGIPSIVPACIDRDNEAETFTSPIDGRKMANGLVHWVLIKGEQYPHGYSREYPLVFAHCPGLTPRIKFFYIYMTGSDSTPLKHTESGVTVACQLSCDFRNVHFPQFLHREERGRTIYNFEFSVRVTFDGENNCVRFEAVLQDKVIGCEVVSL